MEVGEGLVRRRDGVSILRHLSSGCPLDFVALPEPVASMAERRCSRAHDAADGSMASALWPQLAHADCLRQHTAPMQLPC